MNLVLLGWLSTSGCDSNEQAVRITAEDFRFTPIEVHVSSDQPIRLSVINQGREPHECKSSLLAHQVGRQTKASTSLAVLPNQKAETLIRTFPGVYIFYCAIRGHAGMSGTIIVN